jgi:DTW domain-containing protein YfiP
MADIEPLKPSNTGWLIADVVPDTFAFGWARTVVDPQLLALLRDPQWQPYVVFPGEFVEPSRVVTQLLAPSPMPVADGAPASDDADDTADAALPVDKPPLFVLLDATWPEARKMFRKSPYLDGLPVLSLEPDQLSRYLLRRSTRGDHFCTSEVAGLCMELAGETRAAQVLQAYLDVFSHHYLRAKHQLPPQREGEEHLRLRQALHGAAPQTDTLA